MCMAGRAGGQYLHRTGIQYHFQNKGYSTFEAYLADLRQSKRKAVRQARPGWFVEVFAGGIATGSWVAVRTESSLQYTITT